MKPISFLFSLLVITGCVQKPPASGESAQTLCLKRGYALESEAYATCVTREEGYRRLETLRQEREQESLHRDFDRARRF